MGYRANLLSKSRRDTLAAAAEERAAAATAAEAAKHKVNFGRQNWSSCGSLLESQQGIIRTLGGAFWDNLLCEPLEDNGRALGKTC